MDEACSRLVIFAAVYPSCTLWALAKYTQSCLTSALTGCTLEHGENRSAVSLSYEILFFMMQGRRSNIKACMQQVTLLCHNALIMYGQMARFACSLHHWAWPHPRFASSFCMKGSGCSRCARSRCRQWHLGQDLQNMISCM